MVDVDTASREALIACIDGLMVKLAAYDDNGREGRATRLAAAFHVPPGHARLLDFLSDGRPHSKQAMLDFLYFDRADDPPEMKILDVFVCRLRKVLGPFGVRIETVWGIGYHLSDGADVLRAVLDGSIMLPPLQQEPTLPVPAMPAPARVRGSTFVQAAVLDHLRRLQRIVGAGAPFRVTTRAIAAAVPCKAPIASALRVLEDKRLLVVHEAGKQGSSVGWLLHLTETGMPS